MTGHRALAGHARQWRTSRWIAVGVAGLLAGAGLIGGHPAVAGDAQTGDRSASPAVTAAVQVTDNPRPSRAHSSPQLARNPTNGELVIVESEVRHDFACVVRISIDDGRSWFPGGDIHEDPWTQCSQKPINGPYATLTFDPDGVLYVAFYANDPAYADDEFLPLHIFLARSEDGGRTFETNFVFEAPEPVTENRGLHNNDRPMVAVDHSHPSNVYVAWMGRGGEDDDKPTKALVAASRDGGRTFGEPVDVSDERGAYQPRPAVDPDGTLHVIFPIGLGAVPEGTDPFQVARTVYHRRSTDGGQTWSEPVEVDAGNAGFFGGRKYVLAADQNDGTLYAAWYAHEDTHFDPAVEDVDIFLRSSTDGGQTWSDRVTINDDADEDRHINHYNPGISIAPNGRVDVAWYDFRNSPYPERFPDEFSPPFNHDGFQDVYYSYSTDGGQTWAPNMRITDRIINREIGVWSNNVHSHMSVGIASSDDGAYVAWQDSRNGDRDSQAEDVYFATARHERPAGAAGAGAPNWVLFAVGGAALVLGMGLAMLIAWAVTRRGGVATANAPDRA
ncbi:MAG: glycoside hydrolase [Actinomycetota bacterium]|nr:glycoside hydrolase [Actinomycetota bacterium]